MGEVEESGITFESSIVIFTKIRVFSYRSVQKAKKAFVQLASKVSACNH